MPPLAAPQNLRVQPTAVGGSDVAPGREDCCLRALVKNRPGIPSVYRPLPVFHYTGPVFWTGPVFYTGPVSPLGIPEYYWHLQLPYMVTIYTRGELRFKDVREFVAFFRIL